MKTKLIGINGQLVVPREDFGAQSHHLQGTPSENLVEIAGRTCYDSFSQEKSRASKEYHEHIREVRHTSVMGHSMITALLKAPLLLGYVDKFCYCYASEPGWYISRLTTDDHLLTCNYRFLERMTSRYPNTSFVNHNLRHFLLEAHKRAPLIFPVAYDAQEDSYISFSPAEINDEQPSSVNNQYWISMQLEMSRTCSHELVRHGFESGISQRSTRYVDEDPTMSWEEHPLVVEACMREDLPENIEALIASLEDTTRDLKRASLKAYKYTYEAMFAYLTRVKGLDNFTARKQARGAAARRLPHGLRTEMIFTASLREWKEIFNQRVNDGADGEIHLLCKGIKEQIGNSSLVDQKAKDFLGI